VAAVQVRHRQFASAAIGVGGNIGTKTGAKPTSVLVGD
jgi:hypothetical protein